MSSFEEPSTSTGVKRKKQLQYYRKEREEEFPGWLQDSRKGESYAMLCKSCNKDINYTSGKDAIKKHSSSQAHSVSSNNIKSITSLLHSKRLFNTANCYDFEINSKMTSAMAKEYWYHNK